MLIWVCLFSLSLWVAAGSKPNIIVILADEPGYTLADHTSTTREQVCHERRNTPLACDAPKGSNPLSPLVDEAVNATCWRIFFYVMFIFLSPFVVFESVQVAVETK